jgi:hypothetical protein
MLRFRHLIGESWISENFFTLRDAVEKFGDTEQEAFFVWCSYKSHDLSEEDWAWGRKTDEFGTLHHLRLLADEPDFQTMTVVFGEPISQIDRSVFEDVETWGVCSLQGWVNSYESVRFVAINEHTAVITGEYNVEQVKVWLEKYVPIKSLKIS